MEKCLYPFWSKKAKKIRKGEVQKIRVKHKKQEKERERFCDLTRVYVCVSLLCLEVCALLKIRARVRVCVFIVFFVRVLSSRIDATEKIQMCEVFLFKGIKANKICF